MEVLGRLSPAALAHWPTVAKQLSNAGVLGSVDARSVASYCEAFARWCSAADELSKMLIEFGVRSGRWAQEQASVSHNPSQLPTAAAETTTEPRQRARNAIMRRDEVERETGMSRSTIYKRIKDGTFPAPLKIGPGSIGWRVSDIEAFLSSPAHYKVADAAV
jgi:predicted DNA-binding transcriptional regulator AlpA